MRRLYVKRQVAALLVSLLALGSIHVATAATPEKASQAAKPDTAFVDGIAAVVNQNVITLRQLDSETRNAQAQLQKQNIPVPDHAALQKQVLQRMIAQELERQEAVRLNINVTDADVQQALQTIAQRNNLTTDQLRQEVERSGINWDVYLKDLRHEVQLDMLRQRTVDSTIVISDAEVDAFLRTEGRGMAVMPAQPAAQPAQQPQPAVQSQQSQPRALGLGHILVAVPEGASASMVSELRQKAESILARIKGGADFAGLAASSSDGPHALDGGNLGVRPIEGWPDLFVEATKNLGEGQVSGVIQSGNGFHILKVLTKNGADRPAQAATAPVAQPAQAPRAPVAQGSSLVTQTHARHILVKTSQVMSDEQAEQRLLQLRQRLTHGEKFADLAKRYSEDASAPQGGDLGWLTPGETVPAFQQAMDALEPGQVSAPVRSQFGWHLIEVVERRTKDMEDEFKRMQARQILFQRRVEPALEDWLSQLRGQAYIENRLDPSDRKRR